MIGLIDIDSGNLQSLKSALNNINIRYKVCKNYFDLDGVSKIILPGVGTFGDFMQRLNRSEIKQKLLLKMKNNVPFLGICVGFQIIFNSSDESNGVSGLNIINENISHFKKVSENIKKYKIRIPHVGWNNCKIKRGSKLFKNIDDNSDFYFDHSYYLSKCKTANIISTTNYGVDFVSTINEKNIYGVQFHPEKSQKNGLQLLKNFCELC